MTQGIMALGKLLLISVLVGGGAVIFTIIQPNHEYSAVIRELLSPITDTYRAIRDEFSPSSSTMTKEELRQYDGSPGSKGLYLAIVGKVFDVSRGQRFYGPGGGYAFFSGRDGSRAFVTGDFTEKGLVDDVDGLTPAQLCDLQDWLGLYENDYVYIGKLAGNFYDAQGNPTPALTKYLEGIQEGERQKENKAEDNRKFPSCNSEWSQAAGGRVWCSTKSGGVDRSWTGVPRLYHRPGAGTSTRCACIRTSGPPTDDPNSTANRGDLDNPQFKVYPGCKPLSESCPIIK